MTVFFLFFSLFFPFILSSADLQIDQNDDFLDLDIDTDDIMHYKKPAYTAAQVVRALTRVPGLDASGVIELQNILRNDLYLFTHPINQRSLQDMPEFYFFGSLAPEWYCTSWYMAIQPFYNENHKDNFTKDRTDIAAYLNFDNPALINGLEGFLPNDIDLPRVLSLFSNLKIQERRAGIMFSFYKQQKNWYFSFLFPLEYLIRNFFLTDEEKRIIESEPLFNDGDPSTNDEEEVDKFARQHLISDRLGFGDTRIYIGWKYYESPFMSLDLGLESTIPTAGSLQKGLYGIHFAKNKLIPRIDLLLLLNLINEGAIDQAIAQGEQILLGALDRLSQILLENGLGNNGHIGFGGYTFFTLYVSQKITFKTRAALEYLLPFPEYRYYIRKKDTAEFDLLNDPMPQNCDRDLAFLQEQLQQTLFPEGFKTVVSPNLIFKLTSAVTALLGETWQITGGYDIWWQQQENLGKVIGVSAQEASTLRKNIATRPNAFQAKLFGSASYFKKGNWCDWSLTVYGDQTVVNSGIGRDFNLSIRFEFLM